MPAENSTIKINGNKYLVAKELGVGTFGETWLVRSDGKPHPLVLKRLFNHDDNDLSRLKALQDCQLHERLIHAASVVEVIKPRAGRKWAGYLMPWAAGQDLTSWLEQVELNVFNNLCIAVQLTKILSDAHRLGIAHGDLHPGNVKVLLNRGTAIVWLIDWDNAAVEGLPEPRSPGALEFLPPESLKAYQAKQSFPPSIKTERNSYAKTLHWLLFGRSYLNTLSGDFDEQRAVQGVWDSDPANHAVDTQQWGGIPNHWISPELASLFRRALGTNPDERPSLDEWLAALLRIVDEGISLCSNCSFPMIISPRDYCPNCQQRFEKTALVASGKHIAIESKPLVLGRHMLGSQKVSEHHALLVRLGAEAFVTDLASKNGTYRWAGQWIRLPERIRCPIASSDHLRFGDVVMDVIVDQQR